MRNLRLFYFKCAHVDFADSGGGSGNLVIRFNDQSITAVSVTAVRCANDGAVMSAATEAAVGTIKGLMISSSIDLLRPCGLLK